MVDLSAQIERLEELVEQRVKLTPEEEEALTSFRQQLIDNGIFDRETDPHTAASDTQIPAEIREAQADIFMKESACNLDIYANDKTYKQALAEAKNDAERAQLEENMERYPALLSALAKGGYYTSTMPPDPGNEKDFLDECTLDRKYKKVREEITESFESASGFTSKGEHIGKQIFDIGNKVIALHAWDVHPRPEENAKTPKTVVTRSMQFVLETEEDAIRFHSMMQCLLDDPEDKIAQHKIKEPRRTNPDQEYIPYSPTEQLSPEKEEALRERLQRIDPGSEYIPYSPEGHPAPEPRPCPQGWVVEITNVSEFDSRTLARYTESLYVEYLEEKYGVKLPRDKTSLKRLIDSGYTFPEGMQEEWEEASIALHDMLITVDGEQLPPTKRHSTLVHNSAAIQAMREPPREMIKSLGRDKNTNDDQDLKVSRRSPREKNIVIHRDKVTDPHVQIDGVIPNYQPEKWQQKGARLFWEKVTDIAKRPFEPLADLGLKIASGFAVTDLVKPIVTLAPDMIMAGVHAKQDRHEFKKQKQAHIRGFQGAIFSTYDLMQMDRSLEKALETAREQQRSNGEGLETQGQNVNGPTAQLPTALPPRDNTQRSPG